MLVCLFSFSAVKFSSLVELLRTCTYTHTLSLDLQVSLSHSFSSTFLSLLLVYSSYLSVRILLMVCPILDNRNLAERLRDAGQHAWYVSGLGVHPFFVVDAHVRREVGVWLCTLHLRPYSQSMRSQFTRANTRSIIRTIVRTANR
jgi:hypothetical protein